MEQVVGVGQAMERRSFRIVTPQGQRWLLAFVNGAKPSVLLAGTGFSYQKALNHFARISNQPVYFTYSNAKGTYLFAYETMNGHHVLKICTDGMRVLRSGSGRAMWTVAPGSRMTGMGQVSGLVWQNYAWTYMGADPGAAGVVPPGAQTNPGNPSNPTVGAWIQVSSGFWVWFPAGFIVPILGGDGNTYWINSSNQAAVGTAVLTPPAGPPTALAGTSGSWLLAYPGYYVWLPSSLSATLSTMSTGEILLLGLLGLGAMGGVAYLIWGEPAAAA
jgi:hypothetical protein